MMWERHGRSEMDQVKENWPERGALPLRWAALAAAVAALLLAAAAALDARLPAPLGAARAPPHRFLAENAQRHLRELTALGPRVAGSYENEVLAVAMLARAVRRIAAAAPPHHRVELDVHAASGAYALAFIDGMTHMYRDVQGVVVRVRAAAAPAAAARSALLLNCHYDTVPDSPGASDDGAGCAVVLEAVRALAAAPHALRRDVVALLNGAEENVLQGAHAFVTAHRWAPAARAVLNLDACGSGGREVLFQAGPGDPWLLDVYAAAAPHPFASSLAQEIFRSGLVPADTDYRIFRDFGNLTGVDFAWSSNGYVYHTRLDTAERIPAGALQRTGDNVLALAHGLVQGEWLELAAEREAGQPVFFDVVGVWAVVVRAPAALAAALLTLALVFVALRLDARDARRQLFVSERRWAAAVRAAAGAAACGGAAGLAGAALAAAALHALGRRLVFYAAPALLAPLYAAPALAASWATSAAVWRRGPHARLARGAWAARACGGAVTALHAAALAAGAALGLRSAFLPLLWALPAAAASLLAHALGARPAAHAAAHALAAAPPALQTAYLALASLHMFVPIMGRAGTAPLPPDVLMALVVAALAMAGCGWVLPLVVAARRPGRLAGALAAVAACAWVAVACGAGAAYSAERPQRVMVFHTRRTVHAPPAPPAVEHFYWVPELDANTPGSLRGVVAGAEAAAAADGAAECARHPYCGAPYYLPVLSLVARGHRMAAPPHERAALRASLACRARTLHVNVTGPPHVVLIVAPAAGARLGAVRGAPASPGAAAELRPQRGPTWRDARGDLRETYFFALHDARKPRPWILELPVERADGAAWAAGEAEGACGAVSLAGHELTARGAALDALLRALPAWTAPTGWPVDLHLYDL